MLPYYDMVVFRWAFNIISWLSGEGCEVYEVWGACRGDGGVL